MKEGWSFCSDTSGLLKSLSYSSFAELSALYSDPTSSVFFSSFFYFEPIVGSSFISGFSFYSSSFSSSSSISSSSIFGNYYVFEGESIFIFDGESAFFTIGESRFFFDGCTSLCLSSLIMALNYSNAISLYSFYF